MTEDQTLAKLTAEAASRVVRSKFLVKRSGCVADEARRAIEESRALLKARKYPY